MKLNIFNLLLNYVLLKSNEMNIDESHGLYHSMDVLFFANSIYEEEVIEKPYLETQTDVIYTSALLHDMCDNKYTDNVDDALNNIHAYVKDLQLKNSNYLSRKGEVDMVKTIIDTMSYSKVKKNGFPELQEYQCAYNIVREADLLSAYDFDRCIVYQMQKKNYTFSEAFEDAKVLFENRMFKHQEDGLLFTKYANRMHHTLSLNAKWKIKKWNHFLNNKK